jgi:hypothetical protein
MKTFISMNVKINSLEFKQSVLTLKDLIDMVSAKAAVIQEQNRLKIIQMQAE